MEKVAVIVEKFLSEFQDYIYLFLIFVIVGCALTLIFGNKNEKIQNAKMWLLGGIAGCMLLMGATYFAKLWASYMVF